MMFRHIFRWGPFYWGPAGYWAMNALLGRLGERRKLFRLISDEAPRGSVLDLCSGPGELKRWLLDRTYRGIDSNPWVTSAAPGGAAIAESDILLQPWPRTDGLVMVDSLYHFFDRLDALGRRLRSHDSRRVIVAEPVENILPRLPGPLRIFGAWSLQVDGRCHAGRFTESGLRLLLSGWGFQRVFRCGRHLVGILDREPRSTKPS